MCEAPTGGTVCRDRYGVVYSSRGPVALAIDHKPTGLSYVSAYYHLGRTFARDGQWVDMGELIGTVADFTGAEDHLHFEIRHVLDPAGRLWLDSNSLPIDPAPLLYRWEAEHFRARTHQPPTFLEGIAEVTEKGIPLFLVQTNGQSFSIPLDHPTSADLALIDLLRDAFRTRRKVAIVTRQSVFFQERRVITAVRLGTDAREPAHLTSVASYPRPAASTAPAVAWISSTRRASWSCSSSGGGSSRPATTSTK